MFELYKLRLPSDSLIAAALVGEKLGVGWAVSSLALLKL